MVCFRYLFVLFCFLVLHLPETTAQVHEINADFKAVRDTVQQYGQGSTLVIKVDSVYLLNQAQFDYYELLMRLKVDVKKNNANIEGLINGLLKTLRNDLTHLEDLNKEIKINGDSASAIGLRLADSTKVNVNKTSNLLDSVKIHLDSATVRLKRADLHLEKAAALIKEEKKQRCWRNIKWGVGGVLVGLIMGWLIK